MLKNRLIPCLFLKNGLIVRSEKFEYHQYLGNPIHQVERYNSWCVDELIYIDISPEEKYDLRRDDMKVKNVPNLLDIITEVSKKCFMPLTFGGRIRTIEDIRERTKRGADKVTINTMALESPSFITKSSEIFGSQCIVVSIDVKKGDDGSYEVYSHGGKKATGKGPVEWAMKVEDLGAGEVFLNSIDRDGIGEGYDTDLVRSVAEVISIPLIACGGAGDYEDFVTVINEGKADAAAAGNIFNFKEHSTMLAKKHMHNRGMNVRI
ncbi:MAG: imidazole glycerol phosphate synthase cyclase subunit [Candidatus Micrarchaeota archaeon]